MYFNVFGEKVSRARYKEMLSAAKNRRELIAARFDRRELIKMGLITSAGLLAPIRGLSARAQQFQQGASNLCGPPQPPASQLQSPPTRPFTVPFRHLPIAQTVKALNPAPTVAPNTAAGEQRTRPHQAFTLFPPQKFLEMRQQQIPWSFHPDLPLQTVWGFSDSNGNVGTPAPLYVFRYGVPVLVRNHN